MRIWNRLKRIRIENVRWLLVVYDLLIYLFFGYLLLFVSVGYRGLSDSAALKQLLLCGILVFFFRFLFGVYFQIWRYGGVQSYLLLLCSDGCAFLFYYFIQLFTFAEQATFNRCLALVCINLLGAMSVRMVYRYTYKCCDTSSWYGRILYGIFRLLGADQLKDAASRAQRLKAAVVGAGRDGSALAEELLTSASAPYEPVLFIDNNREKIGREIHGIPVIGEDDATAETLRAYDIQEVILAVLKLSEERKRQLYKYYSGLGFRVKTYDYPISDSVGRPKVREFDIEELLFRKHVNIESEKSREFYQDKCILITGGGGSIGSEICRQLAKLSPRQLVVLDIYENGAYDIQQELRLQYGSELKINIEIASVTDREALCRVFEEYRPEIVIMAAAHKHVPLMEKNCIEAVKNNVFGTLNTVEVSEQYGAERVIMVSTDKAVNPVNVMGATKRMCEMIVQVHSTFGGKTTFSATRFGNVLGSAGSVIPLFRRQIAAGGPVTVTDRRIIRYFMTIPEASQLVLLSGAMAKNGELFVLDMGQPVKIMDLAESMIRLSGARDVEIVETGLRPGEKLYEELLVRSEKSEITENERIFIEKDQPISREELELRLEELRQACLTGTDRDAREALKRTVPTFRENERQN